MATVLRNRFSYHRRLFLLLFAFSWALVACFVTFQYSREKLQGRAARCPAATLQPAPARRTRRGHRTRGIPHRPSPSLRRPARNGHRRRRARPVRQLGRLAARSQPPRAPRSHRSDRPWHRLHHPPPLGKHRPILFLFGHEGRRDHRPLGRPLLRFAARSTRGRLGISVVHAGRHAADERGGLLRDPPAGAQHHAAERFAQRAERGERIDEQRSSRTTSWATYRAISSGCTPACSAPRPTATANMRWRCTRSRRRSASRNNSPTTSTTN